MAHWQYAHFKRIIEKVLRIIVALANHPVVREVTRISQLSLPLQSKVPRELKKENKGQDGGSTNICLRILFLMIIKR